MKPIKEKCKPSSSYGILRGLLNWNNNDIKFAYSQIYVNKIFNATMSIKRFPFLFANPHFDDISSRNTHFQHDRAAAVRDIFESFVRIL